jgi:uncharacterized protein YukE
VRAFVFSVLLSVLYLLLGIVFLQRTAQYFMQEQPQTGARNLWIILAVCGILVISTSVFSLFKKKGRGVVIFLIVFWIAGTVFIRSLPVGTESSISDTVALPHKVEVIPAPEGGKEGTFTWKYAGRTYTLEETLFDSYYRFYSMRPEEIVDTGDEKQAHEAYNNFFINGVPGENTVADVAQKLKSLAEERKLNSDQTVEMVASFVETIPYDFDELNARVAGLSATVLYPYEVLYKNTGVCQDKSYLAYQLYKELGFGVALFEFPDPADNHMAVGIQCPQEYSNYDSGYCFLETTSLGNKIGLIPELLPQSRIATSDIMIRNPNDEQGVQESHELGRVIVENQITGSQYTGIVDTISTQKEIARLKGVIYTMKASVVSESTALKSRKGTLESLLKNVNKKAQGGSASHYDDAVSKYEKERKAYNNDVKDYNNNLNQLRTKIARYNSLIKTFYQ